MNRTRRPVWAFAGALAALVGAFIYAGLKRPSSAALAGAAPDPSAQSRPRVVQPSAGRASAAPGASAPAATRVAQVRAAAPAVQGERSTSEGTNEQLVGRWFEAASAYHGRDRAAVIEESLNAILSRGAKVVPELASHLRKTTVYRQTDRAAAFHALGRVGAALKNSDDPEALGARAAIQQLADQELALPEFVPPNPETNLAALPTGDRYELIHRGVLVEHAGQLLQTTTLSKLAAIQMLMDIGDASALAQLLAIQATKGNSVGVEFAAARAIRVVSN